MRSGTTKTVTLAVDVQAQLNDAKGQINNLSKMLSDLKLPDNLGKEATSNLTQLQDKLRKAKELLDGNSFDLVDEKKIHSELNSIMREVNSFVSKMKSNQGKITFGDPKTINALKQAIKDFNKAVNAATSAQARQQASLNKSKAQLNAKTSELTTSQKDLERLNKELDEAIKKRERLNELNEEKKAYVAARDGKKAGNVEGGWKRSASGKEQAALLADTSISDEKIEKTKSEISSLTDTIKGLESQIKTTKNTIKGQEIELERLKQIAENIKDTALADVKSALQDLQGKHEIDLDLDLEEIKSVEDLQKLLNNLNAEDAAKVAEVFKAMGLAADTATGQIESVNRVVEETSDNFKHLDESVERFKTKATYFFGMANAVSLFRRAVRAAFNTVKDLDEVMTQTAVVTDFSVGDMWSQLPEYTRRANELGVSIHDAYEAATLYYQQGLKTNEVMAVSNETLKMARIAQLDAADATSRMTNALRGFNMEINETNAQRVNDVYSELAAITAADTDEISTAMTKVASLAHNANMEFETTSAFLAQMIETTRESAETAGTALKTVIARFSEVKELYNQGDLLGTDEEGEEIDVNKVSIALRSAGINLNEYLTGAKGLDDIFIELASKWQDLDMVQQRYIATMAAGSRQQSRFIAMMSDYKRTTELVTAANTSAGASQRQFEKTLDSLQSKLAQLKNSWDTFLMGFADDAIIKGTIDLLKLLLDTLNGIFEAVDKATESFTGGLGGSVARIAAMFLLFKLGNVLVKKSILLYKSLDKQKLVDALTTDLQAKAEGKEVIALNGGIRARAKNILVTAKETLAKTKNTTVTVAGSKATQGAAMSTWTLVTATLALSTAIIAVIALVMSIIKLYKTLKKDSPKKIFEDAQDSAEAATKAADSLTESYENLGNSLDNLGEKYETLENLTRGTVEWRNAVKEINEEVLKLMENYDDIEIKNVAGVLEVANGEKVLAKLGDRASAAQAAKIGAQQQLALATQDYKRDQIISSQVNKKWQQGKFLPGSNPLGITSFDFDLVHGPSLDFDFLGKDYTKKVTSAFDEITKKISSGEISGRQEIEEYLDSVGLEIDVTDELVKDLMDYSKAINNAKQQTEQLYTALASTAISNANIKEGTEESAVNYLNPYRMESFYIKEYNDLAGEKFANIKEELSQELGYLNYSQYKAENGEVDDESARVMLAQIRAQKDATDAVEGFTNVIGGASKEVQNLYNRESGGYTKEQLDKVGFDVKAYRDNPEAAAQDLMDKANELWVSLTEEQRQAIGSYEEFLNDFIHVVVTSTTAMDQAEEKFAKVGVGENPFTQLTGDTSLKFAKNLESVFESSGKEGVEAIKQQVLTMTEGMTQEQAERFMSILNTIDWDNIDSIRSLSDLLEDFGFDLEGIDEFEEQLIDLNDAAKKVNLEKVTEQVNSLVSVASKISSGKQEKTGFDKETVDALVAAGVADASDFFHDTTDDTYTYIGEEFEGLGNRILDKMDELEDIEQLQADIANGKAFEEATKHYDGMPENESVLRNTFRLYAYNGGSGVNSDFINNASVDELKAKYEELSGYTTDLTTNIATLNQLMSSKNRAAAFTETDYSAVAAMGTQEGNDALRAHLIQGGLEQYLGLDPADQARILEVFDAAKNFELDTDNLKAYAAEVKKLGKTMDGVAVEIDDVTAAQIALANTKQNAGMKKLVDSYEDWTKLIKEDGKLMTDLDSDSMVVMDDLKSATNELLNTAEPLSEEFWNNAENIDLIKQAAEGSTDALIELREAAGEDYLVSIGVELDEGHIASAVNEVAQWIQENAPTMEVGTQIDTGPFIDGINELIRKTGMGADEIQKYFKALGFELNVTTKTVKMPKMRWQETYNGYGTMVFDGYEEVELPVVTSSTYKGGVGGGTTFASPSSGSGGKSGSSEKNNTWENPYDELYNLTEKINEALRTREALERKYEKLVKKTSSSMGEVTKSYYDQIKQLRYEADLQKEMLAGRTRQLNNVGNEYYTDSEGNRSTFADLGVTKYASYDPNTGLLQIDWAGLEALEGDPNKVEEGKAAEAYISRLEELEGQIEDVRDNLWDIEDQIEEFREEAINSYLEFENRVMDDLVTHYQNQIDEYSALSDMIKENTDEIIKGIQDDIALARQIRDNTKKEEDIADKEARLAYLRRDTSGANALEIKKLEEELANSRESYSDSLVDQQIQDMQNEANMAAEQRQHQIEIMQNQLNVAKENGELWTEVWDLLKNGIGEDGTIIDGSPLMKLLKETEAYDSLSVMGQQKWWEETTEAYKRAMIGLEEGEDKYGVDANNDGVVTKSGTSAAIASTASASTSGASAGAATTTTATTTQEGNGYFSKVGEYEKPKAQMPANEVKYLQQALNDAGFTDDENKTLAVDGVYGPRTMQAVSKLQAKIGAKVDGYYGPETRGKTMSSQFKAYATGGIADFTGPAWLDGSKSHPELVLNAKDTQNFIELKDILASMMSGQGSSFLGGVTNISVQVDSPQIASDYDLTNLADKIKKKIYEDSSYRNVNAINFTR